MGTERPIGPTTRRRAAMVATGTALILAVLVVGLAFANSVGASRVAQNATELHWANATLGTAALTRAALVQATTFAELADTGLVTSDDLAAAMVEARDAGDRLTELRDSAGGSPSLASLIHFVARVDQVTADLERGDLAAAKESLITEAETTYLDLVDSLQSEQSAIQAQIDANTAVARRTTSFIQFFLMLAIPGSAVLIYRYVARRQVREFRLKMDLELEKEREVGRAKDEFIAGLSHELRTPLTSIYGFAEILTDGGVDDPVTGRELSQIIANEAAEMTRMVDDLLAAARLESTGVEIELSPTHVSDVVSAASLPFERAGLTIKKSGGDAMVATDAARLRHVLVNLLSNAARHGGPHIGVEVSSGDGVVDIEVWDDGTGVPDDRLAGLFDTFIHNGTATLMTGTLGLGLGVASRLTALLGGKLVYQRFAQKSYFIVSLPMLAGAVGARDTVREDQGVADTIRAMSA